jgi:hypothetical protein
MDGRLRWKKYCEVSAVDPYGADLFTEPEGDPDTLANLGPLRPMAGIFEGRSGSDDHPVAEGGENEGITERYELQPIDFQTNGPQLFYGLRYHTHIDSPTEVGTFHDQVGYWLWEPLAEQVVYTLAIPRGQALLAIGPASADAREFELTSTLGSEANGIVSNPFLLRGFRTTSYRIAVSIGDRRIVVVRVRGVLEIPGPTPRSITSTATPCIGSHHRLPTPSPRRSCSARVSVSALFGMKAGTCEPPVARPRPDLGRSVGTDR